MHSPIEITLAIRTPEDLAKSLPLLTALLESGANVVVSGLSNSAAQETPASKTTKPKATRKTKPKADAAPTETPTNNEAHREAFKVFRKAYTTVKNATNGGEAFACQCIEAEGFIRGSKDLATLLTEVTADKFEAIQARWLMGKAEPTPSDPDEQEETLETETAPNIDATVAAVIALAGEKQVNLKQAKATMLCNGYACLDDVKNAANPKNTPSNRAALVKECMAKLDAINATETL